MLEEESGEENSNKRGKDPMPRPELKEEAPIAVQLVEELITVELIPGDPDKITKIGSKMKEDVRDQVIKCIRRNKDIFAWTPQDLEGIDLGVITHHLNLNPTIRPVKQKKRHFGVEKDKIIQGEDQSVGGLHVRMRTPKHDGRLAIPNNARTRRPQKSQFHHFGWHVMLRSHALRAKECRATYQRLVDKIFRPQLGRNGGQAFEDLKTYLAKLPLLVKPVPGDTLYLYLSSTSQAISSVLVREEESNQTPIYYVSKVLNRVESHYPPIEKMALALVITTRKLSPYFLSYPVGDHHQGQALADFVSEMMGTTLEEVSKEKPWLLHVDGSSTVQGSRAGVVLTTPQWDDMEFAIKFDFNASNNEAEYEALVLGMRMAQDAGASHLLAYSDSQLIIKQVDGEYEAKEESMVQYLQQIEELKTKFKSFYLQQILREENVKADSLSKLDSALEDRKTQRITVQYLPQPRIPLDVQPIHRTTMIGGRL
ncbi:UNVERIFIED_CONTAM: Ribonuclease HI [Sesamum latifolium]|uniref:Ribonuclease HI n=1 Tax=Sesamum latifolium TaxID=2727402 RepID=A0AAW2UGU0_9LAMI